jgi:hypothetical protein
VLTLLITVLATAYFVVPELLSRFTLNFFFVRKSLNVSKSEELVRATFWASVPLAIAWWMRRLPPFGMPDHGRESAKVVFSALYSEKAFSDAPQDFFHAITIFARANLCLLARAYFFVIVGSLLLGWATSKFGRVRTRFKRFRRTSKLLHWLILPRTSEWHLALSTMLLTDPKQYSIEVDVMTGNGILYRGAVQEKSIGADGALQTLILSSPERFLRPEFSKDRTAYEELADKSGRKKPDPNTYWRKIPGELFLLVGSDIKSVNVRHVNTMASVNPADDPELKRVLQEVRAALDQKIRDRSDALNAALRDKDAPNKQ